MSDVQSTIVTVIEQLMPAVARIAACAVPPRETGERTEVKVIGAG